MNPTDAKIKQRERKRESYNGCLDEEEEELKKKKTIERTINIFCCCSEKSRNCANSPHSFLLSFLLPLGIYNEDVHVDDELTSHASFAVASGRTVRWASEKRRRLLNDSGIPRPRDAALRIIYLYTQIQGGRRARELVCDSRGPCGYLMLRLHH